MAGINNWYLDMTNTEALQKAIDRAGGQNQLAKICNTSQPRIWNWLNRDAQKVPAEYVLVIEKATGVSRSDLRPDLYPVDETSKVA